MQQTADHDDTAAQSTRRYGLIGEKLHDGKTEQIARVDETPLWP